MLVGDDGHVMLLLKNSAIMHTTKVVSENGMEISGSHLHIMIYESKFRFVNHSNSGILLRGFYDNTILKMVDCQFEESNNVPIIVNLFHVQPIIINCTFSNNTGGRSVITSFHSYDYHNISITSSVISDNNMTGITLLNTAARFIGHNVIRNNRYTEGAGIKLARNSYLEVDGDLIFYNNTAITYGGGILSSESLLIDDYYGVFVLCSLRFLTNTSSVVFSGNRAGKGGSDMYNTILTGCYFYQDEHMVTVPHIGQRNETSWYFDTHLMKYFHFSNTDRLSSMSSEPIMVCFCNNSNLPDCSDRTQHHIRTYPGLEINTTIATVGYYGGTSPGDVVVSVQHATLVRYYRHSDIGCFNLYILLQNATSTPALVDIRVDGGLQGWGVSIGVDKLLCPIGFIQDKRSGQCRCERFSDSNSVQCNVSAMPFKFLRSGNSWFAYINNTQCITGSTSCPFDYCNRSNVSFNIMTPDRQCVGNRAGILCGQCQSHFSILLGSNHCGACSNWYLFLVTSVLGSLA